jgi:hypothetical protein
VPAYHLILLNWLVKLKTFKNVAALQRLIPPQIRAPHAIFQRGNQRSANQQRRRHHMSLSLLLPNLALSASRNGIKGTQYCH